MNCMSFYVYEFRIGQQNANNKPEHIQLNYYSGENHKLGRIFKFYLHPVSFTYLFRDSCHECCIFWISLIKRKTFFLKFTRVFELNKKFKQIKTFLFFCFLFFSIEWKLFCESLWAILLSNVSIIYFNNTLNNHIYLFLSQKKLVT